MDSLLDSISSTFYALVFCTKECSKPKRNMKKGFRTKKACKKHWWNWLLLSKINNICWTTLAISKKLICWSNFGHMMNTKKLLYLCNDYFSDHFEKLLINISFHNYFFVVLNVHKEEKPEKSSPKSLKN